MVSQRRPARSGRQLAAPRLVALLVTLVAFVGCAGRSSPRHPPPPRPTPTPMLVATPLPTPLPTPTPVPAELACATAADCTSTPYPRPLARVADCYCPTCPVPGNAAVAHAREVAWQQLCAGAWAQRARCLAPMCPRPLAPQCAVGPGGGACAAAGGG